MDNKYIVPNKFDMKVPDKITIGKPNVTEKGDVVFAWLDADNIPDGVEYIRKDLLLDWLTEYQALLRGNSQIVLENVIDKVKNYDGCKHHEFPIER